MSVSDSGGNQVVSKGLLVAVEGLDGTGKSSVVVAMAEALRGSGFEVLTTREPSDGPAGTLLRNRLVRGESPAPEEEVELFLADRREHMPAVVQPALDQGAVVISDRTYISSIAYQGARGIDPSLILARNLEVALEPDLVLLLELDPKTALERVGSRGAARHHFEEPGCLERVAELFSRLEQLGVRRVCRVDASRALEEVVADCLAALEAVRREQPWRARLRDLLSAVVQRGDFVLSSGRRSDFYIDGRLVMLTGEGAQLAGRLVAGAARRQGATAVGGLVMGACPMVTASGIAACEAGIDLSVFYVRKQAKGHGKKQRVEGPALQSGQRVLVVDDVATSGGSLLETAQAVREDTDAQVVGALCLVDRLEGAREALAAEGLYLEALFTCHEV